MSDLMQRQTVSFIIRVWAEYQVQNPTSWYGELLCLTSGDKIRFHRWEDIIHFVDSQTAAAIGRPPATGSEESTHKQDAEHDAI